MPSNTQIRTYKRSKCITFRKTKEAFGGLSNMAAGYPLNVNGIYIRTSEALYQACRFPHLPDIQKLIISQNSPMTAKMKGKPYRDQSRPDWDNVRVKIMDWCLRVKLIQNWDSFSSLLLETGDKPIVEDSHKDDFWGALSIDNETLSGVNALGRLLMQLREDLKHKPEELQIICPLNINNFYLFDKPIETIYRDKQSKDLYLIPSLFEEQNNQILVQNNNVHNEKQQNKIEQVSLSSINNYQQESIVNIFEQIILPALKPILSEPKILKNILSEFDSTITQGQMKKWLELAHKRENINIFKQKNQTLYVWQNVDITKQDHSNNQSTNIVKSSSDQEKVELENRQLSLLQS